MVDVLEAMVCGANKSGYLMDLRLATVCLLGFSGLLQFTKPINLGPCDFVVSQI